MTAGILAIILVIAMILACAALWERRRANNMYREIDRLLDEILSEKPVSLSGNQEGPLSVLAFKAERIQEKLSLEINGADREKEQVKSLVSNMSHQLKTPLSNVRMYAELLKDPSLSGEKRSLFLEKLTRQTEKIQWVISSLLKMVRLEENVILFQGECADIKSTLLLAINSVYEKAQNKQIQIQAEEFPALYLWHNPAWTAEALENILENAVKYSPAHSCITVGIHTYEMYSELWIRDEGPGILPGEETEIFKRFYRSPAASQTEGSGIGLYLVKLILEKEKGYVTVKSSPGQGSTFSLFLQNCKEISRGL